GFGRTGKMFAMEHWGVVPDLMSVAKGIVSSYMPLGGSIARETIADAFAGGDDSRFLQHVLTFAGHPVPAAAALKNIEILESERMVDNSAETGAYFLGRLQELQPAHPMIGNVSGLGLLVGIDLVKDRDTKEQFPKAAKVGERLIAEFEKRALILRPTDASITMGPPLCITRGEVDEIVTGIDEALTEVERQLAVRAH
ncbi:MAG: aspartate aminotransferase family protein, partial [Chloroflexi bacterium]|nr:aspartate aminotransferase family protein [Chloroflexota bacterium]